jgi:hypothetical protein
VYPGTLPANRDPGHYDPVWPPGLPDFPINLRWWYESWFAPESENPEDPQAWEPGTNSTVNTYAHWLSEHNSACGAATYAYVVWTDNRQTSPRSQRNVARKQSDVRLARLSWPNQ